MRTIAWISSNLPASLQERHDRRPLGRDPEAFQSMLGGYEWIVRCAEDAGIDAVGTAEHHFQTEGGEVLPNSLIYFAKLASQTQRIMFLPLSLILPTHDPLRVAEDIALLTHLYPGRIAAGFARGYQSRWVQTLTQEASIAALDPRSDAVNREIFDEYLTVVEKAWSEDAFSFHGKHYQVPFPAEGIPDWQIADWTRKYGSAGEVDEDGVIRKIGVVPKPLAPPKVFVPTVGSGQTVVDAARHGRTVLTPAGNDILGAVAGRYHEVARESGRDVRLGEGFGVVRKIVFGDTFEEAFDLAARTNGFWYHHLLGPFGINEFLRQPDDAPRFPLELEDERALTQRMYDKGALLLGTEEQVHDQVADLHRVAGAPFEWMVWEYAAQSLTDDDAVEIQKRQFESYSRAVIEPFRSAD